MFFTAQLTNGISFMLMATFNLVRSLSGGQLNQMVYPLHQFLVESLPFSSSFRYVYQQIANLYKQQLSNSENSPTWIFLK